VTAHVVLPRCVRVEPTNTSNRMLEVFCAAHYEWQTLLAQCGFEPEPIENTTVPASQLAW
jgi:hypothetical protein